MKERIKFTYSEILVMLAILTVLIIVVCAVVHYCFASTATGEIMQHSQIEKVSRHIASPKIKELMEKHGPGYLYEINKGVLYLHRNGKRIEIGRDGS